MAPLRVHHPLEARARYGARYDTLIDAIDRVDPLADAVVDALADAPRGHGVHPIDRAFDDPRDPSLPGPLRELVAAARTPPPWVDWDRIAAAGRLFTRSGVLGGLTLALRSLLAGYLAPAGNKPLAISGRLRQQAPRRLAETGRFVTAVCAQGGLRPGAEGVRITLKVRLMHAQVRRLLLRSDRWDLARWSLPINQHDMLATILLFSVIFTDGLRILGLDLDDADGDTYVHLWRYVGVLIGVEPDLLPWSEAEARRDTELIALTQGPPDDDSRALVDALLKYLAEVSPVLVGDPKRRLALASSLARRLLGDPAADRIGLPRSPLDLALPLLTHAIHGLDRAAHRLPPLAAARLHLGRRYWHDAVEAALGGRPATFGLPGGLAQRA